jgi:hypothetical protein
MQSSWLCDPSTEIRRQIRREFNLHLAFFVANVVCLNNKLSNNLSKPGNEKTYKIEGSHVFCTQKFFERLSYKLLFFVEAPLKL